MIVLKDFKDFVILRTITDVVDDEVLNKNSSDDEFLDIFNEYGILPERDEIPFIREMFIQFEEMYYRPEYLAKKYDK